MRREDWICASPRCGEIMVVTSSKYIMCPEGDGRLVPRHKIEDLHRAMRYDYKRFIINGVVSIGGVIQYYEYVPSVHQGCLGRAPKEGHIVARVFLARGRMGRSRWRPMTFRKCKPPRAKKVVGKVTIDQTFQIDPEHPTAASRPVNQ